MSRATDEVDRAITELGLAPDTCRKCEAGESVEVFTRVRSIFVEEGGHRRWWWESFRGRETSFQDFTNTGRQRLLTMVPAGEHRVWFIPEWEDPRSAVVYDATIEVIKSVLNECFRFEYYLIAKGFDWLLCENHHDFISFVQP